MTHMKFLAVAFSGKLAIARSQTIIERSIVLYCRILS